MPKGGNGKNIKPTTGSDNDDVIVVDTVDDTKINGGDGNDVLSGGSSSDRINAGDGDDRVTGGAGDDTMFGNDGWDTAVFSGDIRDYSFSDGKGNAFIVDGADGTDTLKHFEELEFDNFTVYLDGRNNSSLVEDQSADMIEDGDDITISLLDGAWDFEGDTMSIASVDMSAFDGTGSFDAATGVLSLSLNGTYQELAAGETTEVSMNFVVTDGSNDVTKTATVTITGTNDAPTVAAALTSTTNEDSVSYDIDLLDGASDIDNGATINAIGVAEADGKGGWSVTGNTVTVDPSHYNHLAIGESETLNITYQVEDEHGAIVDQSLTITVEGRNDAPLVKKDKGKILEDDTGISGNVLNNDRDVDTTDVLSVANPGTTALRYADVTVNADGSWTATPNAAAQELAAGKKFVARVEIEVTDGTSTVSTFLTITVLGANDDPVIDGGVITGSITEAENNSADENNNVTHNASGTVTFNDVDVSDTHTVSSSDNDTDYLGDFSASVTAAGTVSWSFDASDADLDFLDEGESITQSYDVTVDDGNGGTATETVTVTINGAADNTAPVAVADVFAPNDLLEDNGFETPSTASHTGNATGSEWTFSGNSGVATYAPTNPEFSFTSGTSYAPEGDQVAFLQYWSGSTTEAMISQTITAYAGEYTLEFDAASRANYGSNNPAFEIRVDGVVVATIEETSTDYQHHSITFDIPTNGEHTISLVAVPSASSDGDDTTLIDNVVLTVISTDFSDTVATNDSDADAGAVLTYTLDEPVDGLTFNSDGSYTVEQADPAYAHLAEGEAIEVTANYTVTDEEGASDQTTLTFTVTGFGDTSTVIAEEVETESTGDTPVVGNVFDNVNGAEEGDELIVENTGEQEGDYGSLELFDDGTYRYTPGEGAQDLVEGESVTETFDVTIGIGDGETVETEISVTVNGVNDDPILNEEIDPQTETVGSEYSYTIPTDLFVDDEGGAIEYSVALGDGSDLPDWLSYDPDTGTLSGTPSGTDAGLYTITITGTEDDGQQSTYSFTITVLDGSVIDGTTGNDNFRGTINGDLINGYEGHDTLYGDPGADVLVGGDGNDNLRGEAGDDVLLGGAGADYLDGGSGSDILNGGDGNDNLSDWTWGEVDTFIGGDGDDNIGAVGYGSADIVDAGAGNDTVTIYPYSYGEDSVVTLGSGSDTIKLQGVSSNSVTKITDFAPGTGGDKVNFDYILNYNIQNWDGSANPFASGHMQLVQDGDDVLFQIDSNGGGDSYYTVLVFEDTSASDFTSENFSPAYPPDGSAPTPVTLVGTANGETLVGGIGNDTISGLEGGDNLQGGPGADAIDGGEGNDSISGGPGSDTLTGGAGNDYLNGESGDDILIGGDGNDNLSDWAYGGNDTFIGGDGDDYIAAVGYGAADVADAGAGNDRVLVYGNGNAESTITLGTGSDTLVIQSVGSNSSARVTDFEVGAGGDMIDMNQILNYNVQNWDGSTNPFASGHLRLIQDGDDVLFQIDTNGGGDGYYTVLKLENTIVSDFTADNFSPAYPPDGSAPTSLTLDGTSGYDYLVGDIGNDTINGFGGNDNLQGGPGDDSIDGGTGSDSLQGGPGNDTLTGGDGNDSLHGQSGNDSLSGGAGNDNLYGDGVWTTDETFNGGDGNDRFYTIGYGSADTVNAGAGDDYIALYSYNNGSRGDIVITLGSGQDTIKIDGGYFNSSDAAIIVTDFAAGAGGDLIDFSTLLNNNVIQNWDGSSNPFASGHMQLVQDGDDVLFQIDRDGGGNSFDTTMVFENTNVDDFTLDNFSPAYPPDGSGIFGSEYSGSSTDDTFDGSFGDDIMNGLDGNDTLNGLNGNDVMDGGVGNDTLNGGFGQDSYTGGTGNDVFVFSTGFGQDTVTDFTSDDMLDISGLNIGDVNGDGVVDINDLTITDVNGNAVIDLGDGNTITLNGVASNTLASDDFVF